MTATVPADHCVVTVINPAEGKRYKMTLKGDVSRLSVAKLKKYLQPTSGIAIDEQLLKYNGVELGDDVLGGEVGITHGSTLTVEKRLPASAPFVTSPGRGNLEFETLDQQKAILVHERMRREEEYRRQNETVQSQMQLAERRRQELERERLEREAELARLQEAETIAQIEHRRLAELRLQEAERESLKARDLEARKDQLQVEKNLQRQIEMQRLENERKKMLVQQQMAEYEAERARLDRERREHQERVKQHELLVKEKELDLERLMIDGERAKKELELEKLILQQQRGAEIDRTLRERYVDPERMSDPPLRGPDGSFVPPPVILAVPAHRYGMDPPPSHLAYSSQQPISTPPPLGAAQAAHHQQVANAVLGANSPSGAALPTSTSSHHTPPAGHGLVHSSNNSAIGGGGGNSVVTPRTASLIEKERELEQLRRQRQQAEHDRIKEAEIDAQIDEERRLIAEHISSSASSATGRHHHQQQRRSRSAASEQSVQHHVEVQAGGDSGTEGRPNNATPPASRVGGPAASQQQQNLLLESHIDASGPLSPEELRRLAVDNLANLAVDLGVPALQLDSNNTCVVSVEDKYTLLITYDAATQRLYLYSTLTTFIPKNAELKLRLYEFLLEGALLGRDMCGGGVGLSLKNDFILLSTSVYLPKSGTNALAAVTPTFVESLSKWRGKVREFLSIDDTTIGSQAGGATPPPEPQAAPIAPDPPLVGLEVTEPSGAVDVVGVVVLNSKGPAARAGILAGDLIKYVGGRRTATLREFQETVRMLKPGNTAAFVVERAGSQLSCSVLVGSGRRGDSMALAPMRTSAQSSRAPTESRANSAQRGPSPRGGMPASYTYY